jgi:GNAT superfamily N-acetyltransferase
VIAVFAEATSLTAETFDRLYHEVLVPAFPPEELEDIETVRANHHDPDARVRGVVALRDGSPVGAALGEYYERGGTALLAYLAVRDDLRGQGVGTALLGHALAAWRDSLAPTAIFAEVEDPRAHQAGPHGDPVARLRFYDRIGAKLLPVPYTQPSVGPGLPGVPGMFLICLDATRESIPKDVVLSFLDGYLESIGGSTDDPVYRVERGAVEACQDQIPLWALSRAAEMP